MARFILQRRQSRNQQFRFHVVLLLRLLLLLMVVVVLVVHLVLLLGRSGLLRAPQVLNLHVHRAETIFSRFDISSQLLRFQFQLATPLATALSAFPADTCTFRPETILDVSFNT